MAEKFALDQRFRDRSAIEGHKGLFLPRAVVMHGFGDQLFSCSALSGDQDIRFGGGDFLQEIIKGQHFRTLSDDVVKVVTAPDHLL